MDQGHDADRARPTQLENRGFGALLRDHRLAAGLTQDALAARASLSVRGIADLERGARRFPFAATMQRLSEALGLSPAERAAFEAAGRRPSASHLWHAANHIAVGEPDQFCLPKDLARATARLGIDQRGNLPTQLITVIGRDRETAEVRRLLRTSRLLTVTGTGGVGKTLLAFEAARLSASDYVDGVFVVDLAPLSRPELVIPTTAEVLGLRMEVDRQPLRHLVSFLRARRLMLIIDNCEHLIDSCADLAHALMQACPNVLVLATSREPLAVEGERVWHLGPLDDSAAKQLFVERARAQRADFDGGDVATIGQLCQALDNLPLALELAAARVSLLTPGEILSRLHERFKLLKRVGGRGYAPRQRTLRATVDWSYALLEPREQQLFRRLAVFAGPFDLAGASAMHGDDSLDELGRLVDKSLVLAQVTKHGSRYRLLETLRGYAWERLHEAGEVDLARRRHLDHFLARAESLYTPLESVDGPTRVLDDEMDNLRGAMEWCETSDPRAGLRLIGSTRTVWFRRDWAGGRRWGRLFLESCPEPSLARARALLTAGHLETYGDTVQARRLLVEARDLAADLGDWGTHATADALLGRVAFYEGRPADAARHLKRSLNVCEEIGAVRLTAMIRVVLSWALLSDRAKHKDARIAIEQAERLGVEFGDRYIAGMVDYSNGLYSLATGHSQRALHHFRRAITALYGIGEVANLYIALFHTAPLLVRSDPVRAARVAGAALAIAARVGLPPGQHLRQAIDRLQAELEAGLGMEQARAAWLQGEQLSVDEAVAMALEDSHGENAGTVGLSAPELQ